MKHQQQQQKKTQKKQKSSKLKNPQQQQQQIQHKQQHINNNQEISESQQFYSSQDQDAFLLTQKVSSKLLQTVARLRLKDPQLYKLQKNIFQEKDFQEENQLSNRKKSNQNQNKTKFTYKDMLAKGIKGDDQLSQQQQQYQYQNQHQQQSQEQAPVIQEKKAVNRFKQAIQKQKGLVEQKQDNDLFINKGKISKQQKKLKSSKIKGKNQQQQDQYDAITKNMRPQTKQMLKNVWQDSQRMDQTDVFLKQYILGKKWLSKHLNKSLQQQQQIDQQDEQRSLQMDEFEAKYNFRFQQPDGDKIVQYPRKIQQSLRIRPQTRKDKRKRTEDRKKIQQKQYRQQADRKKQQIKQKIINKINQKQQQQQQNNKIQQQQSSDFQNDWFFCDDCGKAFQEQQINYQCNQCQDYMLCQQCNQLIIHKHSLNKGFVLIGHGAPKKSIRQKYLSVLQPCKVCRRRLPQSIKHYEHKDRVGNCTLMCEKCYDQSGLDVKKKFNFIEGKINSGNIEQILQKDPQKVKQLTNSKQIQQMVDQYLKYQFQDVIGGGLKTKFKYINVKPQGYGLSDQQILYGDDKQLNNYISVKKLAPYRQNGLKLRNNIFRKKVVSIDTSVNRNKYLLEKDGGDKRIRKSRMIDKIKYRAEMMKKKRQTRLKILNISNPDKEKKVFVPTSRLASYGVAIEEKQVNVNHGNKKIHNKKGNYTK